MSIVFYHNSSFKSILENICISMKWNQSKGEAPILKKTDLLNKVEGKTISKSLISKIINLKDELNMKLIQKFGIESILANIQKHQIQIVQLFSKYLRDGFNLIQFTRFFLNIIPHHHIENLYLAIGLIDLFREITIETHKDRVVLKDITDYMCEKILKNDRGFNKIEAKFIPYTQFFKPAEAQKNFLQIPPIIYGETDEKIYKLCQKSIKTDSTKHSRAIVKSQFCSQLKKVFILDALSDSIAVYDQNCTLSSKISPTLNKVKKQVIILSFAFSKRQYRIGAVIKDFSLKFWDHFNSFQYQKSISTTSICQNLQTNIYFFQYFNSWITSDKTGTIHFWNLQQQKPDRTMKCKYNAPINDTCQIPSLNLLVVVQECKRSSRLLVQTTQDKNWDGNGSQATVVVYNYYNGQIITEIDLQGMRIPHTLLYSETYQVLFMSGLQKKIRIYDLDPVYMDASLKGELIGHQNLITCFTLIKETPMLVSADDKGKVKLWDFRSFMCLQTIDFSDKTVITNLLDMVDIGKLGVFGSRVNYVQFQDRHNIIKKRNEVENIKIQAIDFDATTMDMYVFSSKLLRVIDLAKGQIKHIFSLKASSTSQQQFTAFRYFPNQKKFILGSSNGTTSLHSAITGQRQSQLKQHHEGAVNFIQFDDFSKLYITSGYDSKILIHRSSDGSVLRELKNNFNGKEINCIQISVYHNLIVIGSHNNSSVYLWNYQYGKIVGEIQLKEEYPVTLHVINGFSILVVGTNKGNLYSFRTTFNSSELQIAFKEKTNVQKNIISAYTDLSLTGKGKQTFCEKCKLSVFCEGGEVYDLDITQFLRNQTFKGHCRDKSSYNPYRECKQTFSSELQKQKHTVYQIQTSLSGKLSNTSFNSFQIISTQLSNLNMSKLLKLEHTFHVTVGNDKRIKIWNQNYNLLCDLNVSYCLPYKWDLKPTSRTIMTQKIYYGIKVLETISKKYENDISIGQSKNLEIKELFTFIEKEEGEKTSLNRLKMVTEPDDVSFGFRKEVKHSQITLLQNEYTRKDLNFSLVKRFNFTQVAGPTLKELDNIKKIESLQREWKIKEKREEEQKDSLMFNIQDKAKKNEEKDNIQFLFVKPKRPIIKETKCDNVKILNLTKKLNAIENKTSEQKKPHMTTFYKGTFGRSFGRNALQTKSASEKKLDSNQRSQSRLKQSFEEYYKDKFMKEPSNSIKENSMKFRDILTQMNGRVNGVKKYRYKRKLSTKLFDE